MGLEVILSYSFLIISYQRGQNMFAWGSPKSGVVTFTGGMAFHCREYGRDTLYEDRPTDDCQYCWGNRAWHIQFCHADIGPVHLYPMAISSSYLAVLVKAKQEEPSSKYIQKTMTLFAWMVKGAVAIACLVSIFSVQIINILYGEKYQGAEMYFLFTSGHWSQFTWVLLRSIHDHREASKYNTYKTVLGWH
jgi:hypothetical protein